VTQARPVSGPCVIPSAAMPDPRHLATRRRVAKRLLPYLCLLYFVAYLDRTNIGIASLQMNQELGFSNEVYGFGAGIFFAGYFLLEIPGTLLVERWSARKWISRIMITWGMVACLTGFMRTSTEFYWLRFALGLAEAGFFPGVLIYLTHWFLAEDRAKTNAMFTIAIPLSTVFGSPISGWLLHFNWLGMSGWRWLLIIEGIPAILLGIVTIFYLTDRPAQAKWLDKEERDWLEAELNRERQAVSAKHGHSILGGLRHWRVLALTSGYLLAVTTSYGISFWLPKFISQLSGLSNGIVSILAALPYVAAAITVVIGGFWGDRTRKQRLFSTLGLIVSGTALAATQTPGISVALIILMFTVAQGAYMFGFPNFWALPTKFLTGAAAAASVGMINAFGNLGGFLGPYAVGFMSTRVGGYTAAFLFLAGCAISGAVLIWISGLHAKDIDTRGLVKNL
ncbi:MAG: MFS transporter, partial [Bryobacteraceae bacterium]